MTAEIIIGVVVAPFALVALLLLLAVWICTAYAIYDFCAYLARTFLRRIWRK